MTTSDSCLELWGWNDFFARQKETWDPLKTARIIKEQRDHYVLINGSGETVIGLISGAWKKRRDDFENPAVGDWVLLGERTGSKGGVGQYLIAERLQRFSQILRKAAGLTEKAQLLATNVDVVFLVSSGNQDFDVRRLERYLTLLNEGVIKPVLVLNKCDLPNAGVFEQQLRQRFPDLPLVLTRSDEPESIEALRPFLGRGKTSVFLGSSGVGKSTLTNHLLGETKQSVKEIRRDDAKGRHTTTGRSMHLLADAGGLIIDTPGLREVQIPSHHDTNLEEAFADIMALSLNCRFPDCGHRSEPNCAVKSAVAQGTIPKDRLEHFHKLKAEIDRVPAWKKK